MTLLVPHVDVVKVALGESTVQALTLIFEKSSGEPPSTPSARFRADHPELMNVLDKLGWDGFFLKRDDSNARYRVSGFALPLIASPRAARLLECMNTAYVYMQGYYDEHLREPLLTRKLVEVVGGKENDVLEALCYMQDIDGWHSGLPSDFPFAQDNAFIVNEQVLVCKTFGELLARVYEWSYVNPKHKAKNTISDWMPVGARGQSPGFFNETGSTEYPSWYEQLDDTKKTLLGEIDIGMRNDLSALPMMGLRAFLESVMIERIGDVRGFEAKLEKFVTNGFVTSQHADSIRKVLDAGSASMHRTYFPNADDLQTCAEVVKHLLHELYVLHPKVQTLAANVPPRPSSK
jgi:Domain of unknown function (DUF4145)